MYSSDFLNSLTPPGFPLHDLRVIIGMPLLLLRNIDTTKGLCNGTRLVLQAFTKVIVCSGSHEGHVVCLPRIDMIDESDLFPMHLRRRQFPVRAAFAMSITKAQGQSLKKLGIYLPNCVWTHGQLYLALSEQGCHGPRKY